MLAQHPFQSFSSRIGGIFLVFFGIALIMYWPALRNHFVFDDFFQIINNPWITQFGHISDIFSHRVWFFSYSFPDGVNPYYRPIMHLVFMFEYAFFGLQALPWHAINIIWHVINATLVFIFILLFFKKIIPRIYTENSSLKTPETTLFFASAFFGAVLFLVHPLHTEVVNWIAAVPELALVSCSLFSILFFITRDTIYFRSFSALFFFFATLSKETGYLVLPFLILLDFFFLPLVAPLQRSVLLWLKKNWLFFIFAGVSLLLRFLAPYDQQSNVMIPTWSFLFLNIFIDGPSIILHYFQNFIFPTSLTFLYPFQAFQLERLPWSVISLTVLILLSVYWKRSSQKNMPLPFLFIFLFTLFWILLFLLPSLLSTILGMSVLADRYFYLPSVGLSIFSAFLLQSFLTHQKSLLLKKLVFFALFLSLFSLATLSYQRSPVWYSGETLFLDSIEQHPDHIWPRLLLDSYFSDLGIDSEYSSDFEVSLRENTSSFTEEGAQKTLCDIRQIQYHSFLLGGDVATSLAFLIDNKQNSFCKEGTPNHQSKTLRTEGMAYFFLGDMTTAEKLLKQAFELIPAMETARSLAHFYCFTKDEKETTFYFEEALRLGDHRERMAILKKSCSTTNPQTLYRELESFRFLP